MTRFNREILHFVQDDRKYVGLIHVYRNETKNVNAVIPSKARDLTKYETCSHH
jgi:hypothetical protein